MKNIYTYELFEKKSVGPIYHYTTPRGLLAILSQDRMASGHRHISFSRNFDLKTWYEDYGAICRIAFNGSDLSDKFHIEPYLFDPSKDPLFGGGTVADPEQRRKFYGAEREEIKGIKKYIIQIDVFKNEDEDERDLKYIESAIADNKGIRIQYVDKFRPVHTI